MKASLHFSILRYISVLALLTTVSVLGPDFTITSAAARTRPELQIGDPDDPYSGPRPSKLSQRVQPLPADPSSKTDSATRYWFALWEYVHFVKLWW